MHYHFQKIDLNWIGSHIDSPDWLKQKKATINPKNKGNKCFKYEITIALNHGKIGNNPERISKIKPFISKYNWKKVNFPARRHGWKKFEQNSETIALNILYAPYNTKEIYRVYKSKYNNERENQVILFMISEHIGEIGKRYYLAFKK